MNTTGRAKGPGPHRTHVRETQKRGVVRQARKGFTVRCFWVAARDWPCRVHRQTKGGFVSLGPRIPAKVRPVSFGPFVRTCSHPPAPAAAGIAFLGPRIVPVRDAWGHTRPRPAPRRPASCSTARALVRGASWRPQAGKARPPRKGRSAPGPREALRDQIVAGVHAVHRDRGKRPPIGVGAKPRNRHPPARQQPRKGNPRGFARGKVATQAYDRRRSWHLGLSGNSGASMLAMRTRSPAAADRVAVVDGRSETEGGGSKDDRRGLEPSALARPRQPALPPPPLAPIVTRRAGIHAGELGWAAVRERRRSALASRAGRRGARAGRGLRGAPLPLSTSPHPDKTGMLVLPAQLVRPRCRRQSRPRERIPAHG